MFIYRILYMPKADLLSKHSLASRNERKLNWY